MEAARGSDEGLPEILVRGKNKVFALGPEVSMPLAWRQMVRRSVKFNYQREVYTRTATKGSEITVLATFVLKPVELPGS